MGYELNKFLSTQKQGSAIFQFEKNSNLSTPEQKTRKKTTWHGRGCTGGHISGSNYRTRIMSHNSHSSFVKINQKWGKWEKKLFNLSAIIITSLYRVITLMTLRHCYVIMSHIQGVSYYTTYFSKKHFFSTS